LGFDLEQFYKVSNSKGLTPQKPFFLDELADFDAARYKDTLGAPTDQFVKLNSRSEEISFRISSSTAQETQILLISRSGEFLAASKLKLTEK
jgi:hypothetical protein